MKRFIVLFIIAFIAILLFMLYRGGSDQERNAINQKYFAVHKFELAGKANRTLVFGHDQGVLYLDSVKSNIQQYNPFENKEDKFYCYIDYHEAEIYTGGLSLINTGDSVYINTAIDSMYIYRGNARVACWGIELLAADSYFKRIKELHGMN